jgi:energy-coupling factor transporter ATPase
MSFIEAKDLVHEYIMRDEEGNVEGVQVALDHLDLNVEQGQFIAVLGHNGSGKSTFAKHLNALLVPSEGTLYVGGMDVSDGSLTYDIRQTAGMVFQNADNQIVSSIIEDDVAFGPENLGVAPEEIRKRVDDSLAAVNMGEYKNKSPHMLSGGQKQRIAIAGAVAMKPDCIIFDEPTSMLDPQGRKEVIRIIKDLNKEGITTILITHFMEEAAVADRILIIDRGKAVMDGAPKEIFSQKEKLKELGLDIPMAVRMAGRLRAQGIDVPEELVAESDLIDFLSEMIA